MTPADQTQRERLARIEAPTNERRLNAYHQDLREINDMPDMAQLPQTRGPDPIAEDMRSIMLGLACGLVFAAVTLGWHFRIWEWVAQ